MNIDQLFLDAQDLHRKGMIKDAKKRYERILEEKPDHGQARLFLAIILYQAGMERDALENAHKAMEDTPHPDANMLSNYGVMLKNAGLLDQAQLAYEQALELNPDMLGAKSNLATLYLLKGDYSRAEPMFSDLTRRLEEPAPWLNLARIAINREEFDKAYHYLDSAEDLDSKHPDIYLLKARIDVNNIDPASGYENLKTLLQLEPANRDAWQLLQTLDGSVLEPEFLEEYTIKLTETNVQSVTTLTAAVDLCRKNFAWLALPKLERMLQDALEKPLDIALGTSGCFTVLGSNVSQKAHLNGAISCWQFFTHDFKPFPTRDVLPRQDGKKLRVGFLSSDLRSHALGFLMVGLFESLPREYIEWCAYSNSFADHTKTRDRIRNGFDRFINVAKLTNKELAQKIYDDNVDILIDLNGMTRDTRLLTLAYRPAPIQFSIFGMPGSTGAGDAVDYTLYDSMVLPLEIANGFSEAVIQMDKISINDQIPPDLSIGGTRKDHGLPDDAVVLCTFNQHYKFSPETFVMWARIMKEAQNTVLWIVKPGTDRLISRWEHIMRSHGIDPSRTIYAAHMPLPEHKARTRHADLILDTLPYNAHTTAVDALSVGVPVLTMLGQTCAGRVAGAHLNSIGHREWIAASPDEYVQKAVSFARKSREELELLKSKIYDDYWSSPIVDNVLKAKRFEAMCLAVYDRAAKGLPPCSMRIDEEGNVTELVRADSDRLDEDADSSGAANATLSTKPGKQFNLQRGNKYARIHNAGILKEHVIGLQGKPQLLFAGYKHNQSLIEDNQLVEISFLESYLGDGEKTSFYKTKSSDQNCFLEPDFSWLASFPKLAKDHEIKTVEDENTVRMDDYSKTKEADFIILNAKGRDLTVLQNGLNCLKNLAMLQVHSMPLSTWVDGTDFFQLGSWLKTQGFILHQFPRKYCLSLGTYAKYVKSTVAQNHIFALDALFIPDPRTYNVLATERLMKLAFFAHSSHRSFDLTLLALIELDKRDMGDRAEKYRQYLEEAGLYA